MFAASPRAPAMLGVGLPTPVAPLADEDLRYGGAAAAAVVVVGVRLHFLERTIVVLVDHVWNPRVHIGRVNYL